MGIKGTVSEISSDPLYKDRWQCSILMNVLLKALFAQVLNRFQ